MKTVFVLYMYFGLVTMIAVLRNSIEQEREERRKRFDQSLNLSEFFELDETNLGMFTWSIFCRLVQICGFAVVWPAFFWFPYNVSFHYDTTTTDGPCEVW